MAVLTFLDDYGSKIFNFETQNSSVFFQHDYRYSGVINVFVKTKIKPKLSGRNEIVAHVRSPRYVRYANTDVAYTSAVPKTVTVVQVRIPRRTLVRTRVYGLSQAV